jgi:hypothetical protein
MSEPEIIKTIAAITVSMLLVTSIVMLTIILVDCNIKWLLDSILDKISGFILGIGRAVKSTGPVDMHVMGIFSISVVLFNILVYCVGLYVSFIHYLVCVSFPLLIFVIGTSITKYAISPKYAYIRTGFQKDPHLLYKRSFIFWYTPVVVRRYVEDEFGAIRISSTESYVKCKPPDMPEHEYGRVLQHDLDELNEPNSRKQIRSGIIHRFDGTEEEIISKPRTMRTI